MHFRGKIQKSLIFVHFTAPVSKIFAKFCTKQQSWWHVMTSRICWQQTINIELDFYCGDKDKLISLNRAHYIHFFIQIRPFYFLIFIILFTFRGLASEASWWAHFSSELRGNERLGLNISQPRSQPRLLRILDSSHEMAKNYQMSR